jgi:pheromone shutdown-related protein TraB
MGEIRLVGTAHVSQKSIDEVNAAIEEFSPDLVAVELDRGRFEALRKEAPEPQISEILKGGNFSQILVQWLLAYLQRRIGMDVGVEPGAEMLAAIREAEARGIPIGLADRDIRITLSRFWRRMPFFEKVKLVGALLLSIVGIGGEEIDVDKLTETDVISAAMEEFRHFAPHGAAALIDERDAFLAHRLIAFAGMHERVLAVVGAGHVEGINRYLAAPETLPPLEGLQTLPKPLPWAKVLGAGVIALFAFLIVIIAFSGVGLDVLLLALLYWVLVNGILSAAFTLLAGGHPLSALTAFAVSWLTSLNPLMAAGWFAAITEAKIRKPQGSDLAKIIDAESFSEMRHVPLFRVVWVAALANVGSTLGTFAYFIFIFPMLGVDPREVLSAGLANLAAFLGGILPF